MPIGRDQQDRDRLGASGAQAARHGVPVQLGQAEVQHDTLAERILTKPEVARLLAVEPNRRNYVLLRLTYIAGLRVSEIAGLKWRDLQPRTDGGQVTVFGKGGKMRVGLLPPAIWRELLRFRQGALLDAPVFPSCHSGGHAADVEGLLRQADHAMYASKRRGGGSLVATDCSGAHHPVTPGLVA